MNYLLDTNVVSELTKPAPDPKCLAWLQARAAACAIFTVTLAELRYGLDRLPMASARPLWNGILRF